MKRFFQIIGLMSLFIFSFFLTEKTTLVIKDMDEIMIMINNNKENYKLKGVDAVIKNDGIIPGISKRSVNVDKSYKQMKEYGKYDEDLYYYDYIKPKISIIDNKDKYIIGGNPEKRMISLNFIVNKNDNINNIIEMLNKKNIKATFFITDNWLEDNLELVYSLINSNHNFGINKGNYDWMKTIINKIGKQNMGFCYYKNIKIKRCQQIDFITIKGIDIKDNYLINTIKNLNSGTIFNYHITSELEENLESIIDYILRKGYTIENIENHIRE